MTGISESATRNTSAYYPFFTALFETADMMSYFWQPVLKAVGGSQLELAGLQARQAQAFMHWTHQMLRPSSPLDVFNANAQLWRTMTEQCVETAPRVAAAVSTATQAAAPSVLPLPAKPSRDTLLLMDRDQSADDAVERKVA